MASNEVLFFEHQGVQGSIGHITLTRPRQLNSLNMSMSQRMVKKLLHWQQRPDIKIILLDGDINSRAFCAGGDLKQILAQKSALHDNESQHTLFWHEYRLIALMASYNKPIIACCHGFVMGAGMGLAMHSDFRIATPSSLWAMPEVLLGFFPDVGSSYFFNQLTDHVGWYLAVTAKRLNISDLVALKWVDACYALEQTEQLVTKLLSIAGDKDIVTAIADCLNALHQPNLCKDVLPNLGKHWYESLQDLSWTSLENWIAQVSGHSGLTVDATQLQQAAPVSIGLTWKLMHWARGKTVAECIQMDYKLALHCIKQPQCLDGMHATVIKKQPKTDWLGSYADGFALFQAAQKSALDLELINQS